MDFLISFGFRQGYYTTLVSLNARGIFTAALRPLSDFGIMAVLSPPTPAAGGGGNRGVHNQFSCVCRSERSLPLRKQVA